MTLTIQELKKIKALHVVTKLPIYITDRSKNIIKAYRSDYGSPIIYDLARKPTTSQYVTIYYGLLREVFLSVAYKGLDITVGPYLTCQLSDEAVLNTFHSLTDTQKCVLTEKNYMEYYHSIPTYSLGDMRDFLVLLGSLFNIDLEQEYSDVLHRQVYENALTLQNETSQKILSDSFQEERYIFHYENKMLNLVQTGDINLLKNELAKLGCSVIPVPSSDSLRTEKDYTIIILEKLSSLAIQVGKDILSVIQLRDFYIRKLEEQTELIGVLKTRDSAIIHFTKSLHGLANSLKSPLIRGIVQYINLKIYDPIKVADLAKQFYISESSLRRNFKQEMGMTIIDYISTRKIEEAKVLLQKGIPISDTARRLSYYDMSHFHRSFKKHTGMTPQQFRLHNNSVNTTGSLL